MKGWLWAACFMHLSCISHTFYPCRKVHHKNVVQFIGACTRPPNFCIVTGNCELLLGTFPARLRTYVHRVSAQFNWCLHFFPFSEFLSGGSMYDFLHKHRGAFSLQSLLRVAIDVSRGMKYLHQNNIIHRDLKAANLLMDGNGVRHLNFFFLYVFSSCCMCLVLSS